MLINLQGKSKATNKKKKQKQIMYWQKITWGFSALLFQTSHDIIACGCAGHTQSLYTSTLAALNPPEHASEN